MTDLDLDALEATARAATPGPWHRHPHPLDDQMSDIRGPINDDYDVVVYAESDPSDAEHIATFDPPTVLALIARLREAEATIERLGALAYTCPSRVDVDAVLDAYQSTKTENTTDRENGSEHHG